MRHDRRFPDDRSDTSTGRLPSMRPVAPWPGRQGGRRHQARLRAQAQSYDLGVTSSSMTPCSGAPRHPEGARFVLTLGQERGVCEGCQFRCSTVIARLGRSTLHVTNEDSACHRGSHGGIAAGLPVRRSTASARAEATSWLSHRRIRHGDRRSTTVALPEVPLLAVLPVRAPHRVSSTAEGAGTAPDFF